MEPQSSAPAVKKSTKLSNNNYFVVLLMISLVVVGVAGISTKAFIAGIVHDSKVVSAKNKAKNQLDSDVSTAPQLVSSYQALSAGSVLTLRNALPTTADFPGLISLIEAASAQAGVNVSSISPDTTSTDTTATTSTGSVGSVNPTPQPFAFGIEVTGSYPQLLALFNNLELSARPIVITSVEMTGSNSSIDAQINLTTYYQAKSTLPFTTEVIK